MKSYWTEQNIPDLSNKVIIVTGANSGIGLEATKLFAKNGATVIMACRTEKRGNAAKAAILEEHPAALLDMIQLDLEDFNSIEAFLSVFTKKYDKLNILLNNAGIMAVPYGQTKQGLERQIGVNHFGHYYLTMKLLPLLNKSEDARIVNIASIAHRFGKLRPKTFKYNQSNRYNPAFAYAQTKLANLLFTNSLASKLKEMGSAIMVVAAHPGVSSTNLGRHNKSLQVKNIAKVVTRLNQSAYQGCLPGVRAAVDHTVQSGEYYGPHGFYDFRGHPVIVKQRRKAYRADWQQQLWDASVEITGLDITL